jgi:hypothetical protein
MIEFKTSNMYAGAYYLAQTNFVVEFVQLEPINRMATKFNFVFNFEGNEEEFSQFKRDYTARKGLVEPHAYKACWDLLKDTLKEHSGV